MQCDDLFSQLRGFRNKNLRKATTRITMQNGRQYTESRDDSGLYSVTDSGTTRGYVLDPNDDITVALVAPGLILGSQDVAMESRILQDFEVTHILNVGYRIPNYFESKYVYKNVDILDFETTNIRTFFDGCFDFIDDGRQQGCILVHCNAGVSRAPTVVIAYLMNRKRMRLNDAFALVKGVRACIRPNDGFMKTLHGYDKELFEHS